MWLADISMYFTQHVGLHLYVPQDHMVVIELSQKEKYCVTPSKYLSQIYYLSKQAKFQKYSFLFLEKVYTILKYCSYCY